MENLNEVLKARCRIDASKNAFLIKRNGNWNPVTWREVDKKVEKIAAGLLALGLQHGDSVSILGNTRLEWTLTDLGALKIGCVSVGIYQTLSGEQSSYILKDSSSKILFAEDMEQVKKIVPHLDELPMLKKIIIWDGTAEDEHIITMDELLKLGEEKLAKEPEILHEAENKIHPKDTAIIIYTSGTTGPPKGACLSHWNIIAQMKSIETVVEDEILGDVMMFFLPLSHVGERVPGQFFRIYKGITGAYVNDITQILDDIKDIRPAFFGSVPRIFEKAYAKIMSEVEDAPYLKKSLFLWADKVGREISKKKQKGQQPGPALSLQYAIADKLVFKKIREIFGGRCKYFLSASAPIAVEILEFFHACGMLILEGYGQTEVSCFCTLCSIDDYCFGTVGKPIPGASLKIAEDGEILVKGDIVFKGYLNQPDLNRQTLTEDGWIYTGDVGRIDENGFLWITGRKKEIIITSSGKNITPSNIENILKNDPLIEHVMLHGDKRKYATALISLEHDNLMAWAKKKGYNNLEYKELINLPALQEKVQASIDRTNSQVARFETIKKFALLPTPLTVETGELTPTMKVRRKIVETKYLHLLDDLYE